MHHGHSFLPGNDAADKLARRGVLLVPYATSFTVSLISRIHSFFSDWRRSVTSTTFDSQLPSISTEELVLPCYARCVLSRLHCNGYNLLLSFYLSRIGRTENPSCSVCGHTSQDTSHLILHCPATDSLHYLLFADSLSFCDLWSRPWGVAALMIFLHVLIFRKGSGSNNNTRQSKLSQAQCQFMYRVAGK